MRTTTLADLFGGSLMAPVANPYPTYRELRDHEPALKLQGILGEVYLVTRHRDVAAILRDPARFSSQANARGIGLVVGRTLIEMDGQEHLNHRRRINPFLTLRLLETSYLESMAAIADDLIDGFVRDGEADLVRQFAFLYPLRVLLMILGVAVDDHAEFQERALDLISVGDNPERGLAASAWFTEFLRPIVRTRRAHPSPADLIGALVHPDDSGEPLSDDAIVSFLKLLLPAGAETTYRLIGSTMAALLLHPEALEAVRTDPGLLDATLDEVLRWESPVQFVVREATESTVVAGQPIAAGEHVFLALGSANRDERCFREPDRFDVSRRADETLPFGFGRHYCPGARLARLEAGVALRALLHRLVDLAPAGDTRPTIVGLAFRSPRSLTVTFTPCVSQRRLTNSGVIGSSD